MNKVFAEALSSMFIQDNFQELNPSLFDDRLKIAEYEVVLCNQKLKAAYEYMARADKLSEELASCLHSLRFIISDGYKERFEACENIQSIYRAQDRDSYNEKFQAWEEYLPQAKEDGYHWDDESDARMGWLACWKYLMRTKKLFPKNEVD